MLRLLVFLCLGMSLTACRSVPAGYPGVDSGEALVVVIPSEKAAYFKAGQRAEAAESLGESKPENKEWSVEVLLVTSDPVAFDTVLMQVAPREVTDEELDAALDRALEEAYKTPPRGSFSPPLVVALGYECGKTIRPSPRERCVTPFGRNYSLKYRYMTYQTCERPGRRCKYAIAPTTLRTTHTGRRCRGPGRNPRWLNRAAVCFP